MNSTPNLQPSFRPLELAAITDQLSGLLARETESLTAMRLHDALALRDDKARLARIDRAALEELRAGRASLRDATSAERQRLAEAADRLARIAADNERALRAGRAAIERLVAAIARAVASKQRRLGAYAPTRRAPDRLVPMGAVAVDRRL